jgi:ketosteroid isomerase-like protein
MANEDILLQAIDELHKKDKIASLSGDTETLLNLMTDDGIVIPHEGEIFEGKKGLRIMLEQNKKILKEYDLVEYNHDFKEVKIIGKFAYEWGYYSGKYISKSDSSEVVGSGKLMRILELQVDGNWKIARSIWTVDND